MNTMHTNDHEIRDYSAVLKKEYEALGGSKRAKFDEEAFAFYNSQILFQTRKEAHSAELAKRIGADKSYISRIDKQ